MGIIQVLEKAYAQTAVYWATPISDGYGGNTYTTPIEISCRWEYKQEVTTERKGTAAHGEEIISTAQVYVLQDVSKGEYLYLGGLNELDSNPDNPKEVSNAFKVVKFEKTPVYRSTSNFLRKVYL
jgi:hypothetical protein